MPCRDDLDRASTRAIRRNGGAISANDLDTISIFEVPPVHLTALGRRQVIDNPLQILRSRFPFKSVWLRCHPKCHRAPLKRFAEPSRDLPMINSKSPPK